MRLRRALRGLTGRILLLVALGTAAILGVLGAISSVIIEEASRRSLQQRLVLAQTAAAYVDAATQENLAALQQAAPLAADALLSGDAAALRDALHGLLLRTFFSRRIVLVDAAGRVVAAEPSGAAEALDPQWLREILAEGRPAFSDLRGGAGGAPPVVVAAVAVSWGGAPMGALVGEIDLRGAALEDLLRPVHLGPGAYADLVDGRGVVLASTRAGRVGVESDHGQFLAHRIGERRAVVSACHGCHTAPPAAEVMALAPLTVPRWGITIREPEAEALAPSARLRRGLLIAGTIFLAIGLLLAWGTARSVAGPVRRLTEAARRVAGGDLEGPIPPAGQDEIGELARSLEVMRAELSRLLARAQAWTEELEHRVQERTAALEATAGMLREKEEARGELLRKLITAQEEERKRIARELHDETSQVLATLALGLEAAAAAPTPDAAREKLAGLRKLAVDALDGVHRIIHALRPSALDDLGLVSAIRWYAETLLEPHGLEVDLTVRGDEGRLPPAVETALFRTVQEALTNVAKHAEADRVAIAVAFRPEALEIRVEDDGRGFDVAEALRGEGAGLGLLGMRERMSLLDGTLDIASRPGGGTRLTIRVPRREEAPGGQDPRLPG
ncbi:MAG TPA: ATP-binding protein [Candidatus Sulfotelmatobacter sp.]|nr:ATP-binding protein [Candidatus Sulfotelmatobacter sp.]